MKGQRTLSKIEPSLSTQHLRGSQPFSFFSSSLMEAYSRAEGKVKTGWECVPCVLSVIH